MKLVLGLALGIAAVAEPAHIAGEPAPRLGGIAMDTHGWGRLVSEWTIDAEGTGHYTRAEPDAHSPKRLVTRRVTAGAAGFRKLRALLRRAETLAGPDPKCNKRIYDLEYGTVRWAPRKQRIRALNFDRGCPYAHAPQATDDIAKAEALVKSWAAAGPILETRKVDPQ